MNEKGGFNEMLNNITIKAIKDITLWQGMLKTTYEISVIEIEQFLIYPSEKNAKNRRCVFRAVLFST